MHDASLQPPFPEQKRRAYPLHSLNHLRLHQVVAQPATYQGRKAVQVMLAPGVKGTDQPTFAIIEGTDFHNGEISVNLVGRLAPDAPPEARGFVGIAFRINQDASRFEAFYLRPANGRADDQVRRNHSAQYFSYPDYPFSRLRKETPEKYETYVDLVPGEWTKVRIEVTGGKARLYVHGSKQPVLLVNDLKHGSEHHGDIGLWTDIGTEAYFSNLRITYNTRIKI
jgi:hypothetical protein